MELNAASHMDGSPKSKSASGPPPRRSASKCPAERFGVSRCRRSTSRKSTGKRRARKQLRQPPNISNNNSDSESTADNPYIPQFSSSYEIYQRVPEDTSAYLRSERNINDYSSIRHRLPPINHTHIPSLCVNCGDYVSHSPPHRSFRSLPNYVTESVDNPSHDISPDGSSGPISFDSGIEQHNSLPYTRSLNSSPFNSSSFPLVRHYYPKFNSKDNYNFNGSVDASTLTKNNVNKNERLDNARNVSNLKSTKTVETQTEWIPPRVANNKKFLHPKISIDRWKTFERSNGTVKLLQFYKTAGHILKDKTKFIQRSSTSSVVFEEDFERGYYSDTAAKSTIEIIMPVGTNFVNTAMKNSFSLSSLQGNGGCTIGSKGSPIRLPAPPERPYHSLTKKRKDPNRELWRRSWGSTNSNQSVQSLGSSATLAAKDDFWAALKDNYNYIMDNQLVDSCKEANGELNNVTPTLSTFSSLPSTTIRWSVKQLIAEFSEICQWLSSMQENFYASPKNLTNKALRDGHLKELIKNENKRQRFLDQAAAILSRNEPEASAEVNWRSRHLVLKWNRVLHSMSVEDASQTDHNSAAEHEVKCLRRWLHEMEDRLEPLCITASTNWNRWQLDQKTQEHQVLQREVQWQGRIVSSVVRLCHPGPSEEAARALERRWHLLYLRALEWQCHLESCLAKIDSKVTTEFLAGSDGDEGPVTKHRRLTCPPDNTFDVTDNFNYYTDRSNYSDEDSLSDDDDALVPNYSMKDTSAGSEADTEGSVIGEDCDMTMASLIKNDGNNTCPDAAVIEKYLDVTDDLEDQVVAVDAVDNKECDSSVNSSLYDDDVSTPQTVNKRPKKVDSSKFKTSTRLPKNRPVFYFRHHDTDSDRQMPSETSGTESKSPGETSEDEWTYTACDKENSDSLTDTVIKRENSDIMTSSCELQSNLPRDNDTPELGSSDPGNSLITIDTKQHNESNVDKKNTETMEIKQTKVLDENQLLCKESITRLLNEAEEMVQRQVHHKASPKESTKSASKKSKVSKSFKPLVFGEDVCGIQSQSKISRIKKWVQQNRDKSCDNIQEILDSCDASGEYTTGDSEPERLSATSDELSQSIDTFRYTTSQEQSINIEAPTIHSTPEHTKVIFRGKRNNNQGTRPWSVSCISQLSYQQKDAAKSSGSGDLLNTPTNDNNDITSAYEKASGMSISESALNTLVTNSHILRRGSSKGSLKYQGSMSSVKTIQGTISSSNTINETTVNYQTDFKQPIYKRKRSKLRRRHHGMSPDIERKDSQCLNFISSMKGCRLTKSCSFTERSNLLQNEYKQERCTASDPPSSRNKNRFDTSSSSCNDTDDDINKQSAQHCRSTDRTLNPTSNHDTETLIPKFKLGPEGGIVRPRLSLFIENSTIARTGLDLDRESDADKSLPTGGTEEHSSFSEQAWDSYQEKYNSEPYSEAPDSDAARKLLDCDDYRAFLDSPSDGCSSLSAHPDHEPSPMLNRRKSKFNNYSPTDNNYRATSYKSWSVESSNGRRSKKSSISSIDRKKSLVDSLERSKRSPDSLEKIRRTKKVFNDSLERRNNKRISISESDFIQSQNHRRYTSSNSTNSDANNSSLEYTHVRNVNNGSNKPDIIDSLGNGSRKGSCELNKLPLSVELGVHESGKNTNSLDSPLRRKRYSNSHMDDSSDGADVRNKNHSLPRRKNSNGVSNDYGVSKFDSDSDSDYIQNLMERSRSQLDTAESVLSKDDVTPDLLQHNDYNEIVSSCLENIRCLESLLTKATHRDSNILSISQIRELKGLISRWSEALSAAERRSAARTLRRDLLALRGATMPLSPVSPLHTRPQLQHRIEQLRKKQDALREQRPAMIQLNVDVHRLCTNANNTPTGSTLTDTLCNNLKNEVTELYRLWDESNESTDCEINQLEGVIGAWAAWERGLDELHGALRNDSATLRLIEAALAGGDPTLVAPHVSHVARLLSETTQSKGECGSWSDSGISDSGSEQELSERERRLTALRTLAKGMEVALAPGSQLLKAIAKKMDLAESELRSLQTACRELIVRTAGGVAGNAIADKHDIKNFAIPAKEALLVLNGNELQACTSPDEPDSEPGTSESISGRMKRWAWCTLPLQICLLALLCACLLGGPKCCDAVNNLGTGLTPHLRYIKGPPPV